MSDGNTKLLKAAKQFCEAHTDCELCPLHGVYMCFCDLEDHYTHVDCKDFIESEVIK